MNKQKFEAKCQEFYTHEDDTYAKVLEFIEPFSVELTKLNCKIDCEMFWTCLNKDGEHSIFFERIPIKKYNVYACNIRIVIQAEHKEEITCMDEPESLQIIDDVTKYYPNLFGWVFRKYNCDFIFKNLENYVNNIKTKGLKEVLKDIPN